MIYNADSLFCSNVDIIYGDKKFRYIKNETEQGIFRSYS